MKFLVLVLSLVGAAYARPGDLSGLSGSYLPSTGGSSILSGISEPSGSYIPQGGSSILSGLSGGGLGGVISGGYSGGYSGYNGGDFGGLVQDQRHAFFYAAPDDEGPAHLRVNIAPSSHRSTKIIFVKAPSYGGVVPEVIAPPSQHEDKTLVYVLVKKQQQGGEITIPSSLGVKQTKPQVYFVKYRNQQEAEQAVQGGLNGQVVGSGLSDLGNEVSFARTLSSGGFNGGLLGGGGGNGVGGYYSGSSVLGATSGGLSSHGGGLSSFGGGISSLGGGVSSLGVTRYGTPGASGPYKR